MNNISLNKFDINNIRKSSSILIISEILGGKTTLTKEILNAKNKKHKKYIFNPIENIHKFYKDVPNSIVNSKFSIEAIDNIIKERKNNYQSKHSKGKLNKLLIVMEDCLDQYGFITNKNNNEDELMIVMDDCLGTRKCDLYDKKFKEYIENCKSNNVSFIVTARPFFILRPISPSSPSFIPRPISPSLPYFDYIFLFYTSNFKMINEYYFKYFQQTFSGDLETFREFFLITTENYGCLVIDVNDTSGDYRKKMFWYKSTNNNYSHDEVVYEPIKLDKFNLNNIEQPCLMTIFGKRQSGKSYLTKDILYHKRNIQVGIVVSPAEKYVPFYSNYIPPGFIYETFQPKLLDNIFKRQGIIISKNSEREKKKDTNLVFVLDDLKFSDIDTITKNKLFQISKKHDITSILTFQSPPVFNKKDLDKIDYVFLLDVDDDNIEILYEYFGNIFPNFNIFEKILKDLSGDNNCLVIDNREKSEDYTEKIFWYKAKELYRFKFGSSEYRNYIPKIA